MLSSAAAVVRRVAGQALSFSSAMASATPALREAVDRKDWTLAQTMIRVTDPAQSIPFFEKLGFRLLDRRDFPDAKFSLYFMATLPDSVKTPTPGTAESKAWVADWDGCVLELTHNHGTEAEEGSSYHNGNSDPRGFGHIGVTVPDVYKLCDELKSDGVAFKKEPDAGSMKGLAFVMSPQDEYWVEILKRTPGSLPDMGPSFQQTMLRVRDPAVSVPFYQTHFGMTLVARRDFPSMDFSLYFMAALPTGTMLPPPDSEEAWAWVLGFDGATLELTHNYGTEKEAATPYVSGNKDPRGFGHIAFMADDLNAACDELEAGGVGFQKKPSEGRMKTIAFALDPDGYWIEIIQRATSKGLRSAAAAE